MRLACSDNETSREAAESMYIPAKQQRARVLSFINSCGQNGATCDEVEKNLGLRHQSASARLWELHHKIGALHRTDRTRLTRTGRKAKVYIADSSLRIVENEGAQ